MNNITPISQLNKLAGKLSDKKVVLVGGCFDILHIGHITFLKKAKQKAEILIILLESDEKIRMKKGEDRPINNQKIRAQILSSLKFVDYIVLLPNKMQDKNYDEIVKTINPKFIATTVGDKSISYKKRSAALVNARVVSVTTKIKDHSSTKLWKLLEEI